MNVLNGEKFPEALTIVIKEIFIIHYFKKAEQNIEVYFT
jgi:hypothetical protein